MIFITQFANSVVNPLMPLFLARELGIADPGQLAFWSGVSAALPALMSALTSPGWGALADRFGRRDLVVRAIVGSAAFTALLAAIQSTGQLAATRAGTGALSGVNASVLALVAAESPPRRLPQSLGALTTARSLGNTFGPAVGGIAGSIMPIRLVFIGASVLTLVSLGPVFLGVREKQLPHRHRKGLGFRSALRSADAATRRALLSTMSAQGLGYFALSGAQQLILVRVIQLDPVASALWGGAAFAAISLGAALTGLLTPRFVPRAGFRRLTIGAALALGLGIAVTAALGSPPLIVAAAALVGASSGAHTTASASMLGLETPGTIKGATYGLSSSALSIGTASGAFLGGLVAAALGPAGGLYFVATAAIGSALVVARWGREPDVEAPSPLATPRPE